MEEIKLKILGSVSPYSKDNKNCPGYLIKYNNQNILFDCGNGCTRLLNMSEDLNNLKIFITHLHPDHIGDLISLLQAIRVYRRYNLYKDNIDLYIPETFERVYDFRLYEDGWDRYVIGEKNSLEYDLVKRYAELAEVNLHKLTYKTELNNCVVEAKKALHDIESYSLKITTKIGTISYSGDTAETLSYNADNGKGMILYKFVENSDIFICESTFLKDQKKNGALHLSTTDAAWIAKKANVKKLILTHFWPEIDKEEYVKEAKELFNNVEAAEEGKQYILRR
ncbi:MAG: MBL fold metallo-hydrolase [Bacilli bacterium]|nr:MBL fold metallo-hydrolase [Bacilli bacterium]